PGEGLATEGESERAVLGVDEEHLVLRPDNEGVAALAERRGCGPGSGDGLPFEVRLGAPAEDGESGRPGGAGQGGAAGEGDQPGRAEQRELTTGQVHVGPPERVRQR